MDFYACKCFANMCVCVPHMASWSEEGIRSLELDLQLLTVTWVLGAKPVSSARTASVLKHWVI